MTKQKKTKKVKPPVIKKEQPHTSINNCNFEVKVEDNKSQHMYILADTVKALLNVTEFFKNKQIKLEIESLVSISSSGVNFDQGVFKGGGEAKNSIIVK